MSNLKLSMEVWPNMPWGRLEICGCAVNSWGNIPLNELVYKVKEHGYEGMDIIYSKIAQIPPEEKPEIMRKTKEAGMNEHLTKPVDGEKLLQVLYRYKKTGL